MDLKDLGSMAKFASEARAIQARQEQFQEDTLQVLRKIYAKLEEIQSELKRTRLS